MDVPFSKIEEEYRPNIEDTDEMLNIKEKFFNLSEAERRIFMVYMDEGTYSGVAKFFGVSCPTAKKYIKRILQKFQ